MGFDDLVMLAKGIIRGWNKGKLEKKLKATAALALDKMIEVAELEEKVRQLQDENRQLKGEKAKPKIKKVTTSDLNPSKKKPHHKSSKKEKLEIDEEVEIDVEVDLPNDAKSVGYREVVVQELRLERRNIRFKIERYYSESQLL